MVSPHRVNTVLMCASPSWGKYRFRASTQNFGAGNLIQDFPGDSHTSFADASSSIECRSKLTRSHFAPFSYNSSRALHLIDILNSKLGEARVVHLGDSKRVSWVPVPRLDPNVSPLCVGRRSVRGSVNPGGEVVLPCFRFRLRCKGRIDISKIGHKNTSVSDFDWYSTVPLVMEV